jgi:predicted nucleotide-binding protein
LKPSQPPLFVSYARDDSIVVHETAAELRQLGVNVWLDLDQLKPGEPFLETIREAFAESSGLLLFASAASLASRVVLAEIEEFAKSGRLIVPVLLEAVAHPTVLQLAISGHHGISTAPIVFSSVQQTALRVAVAVRGLAEDPTVLARPVDAQPLAESRAAEGGARRTTSTATPPRSVFIVHGHDGSLLAETERYLVELGVEPVVLQRIGGPAQSLFQKFLQWGRGTHFALVLLGGDDLGASRLQYEAEGIGEKALQFRTRQNVLLELGFFYGYLGWENVFVLLKAPARVFPNFERPSDLEGVVFDRIDDSGDWRAVLRRRLAERGFAIADGGSDSSHLTTPVRT